MATTSNTSPSLLLIAKLIQTPEGIVWRPLLTITGPGDLEGIARDHAGPLRLPVLVPLARGYHHALHSARRKINQLVFRLNRVEGIA
jgi:hypothetical protein